MLCVFPFSHSSTPDDTNKYAVVIASYCIPRKIQPRFAKSNLSISYSYIKINQEILFASENFPQYFN